MTSLPLIEKREQLTCGACCAGFIKLRYEDESFRFERFKGAGKGAFFSKLFSYLDYRLQSSTHGWVI
jgi:hypothetical protein